MQMTAWYTAGMDNLGRYVPPGAVSVRKSRDWSVFFSSVFFVLGFSSVFSLVGVLLKTILAHSSYTVQEWLGRIGGIIIIFFGLFVLGLIKPAFLRREHKLAVRHTFRSHFAASFVFGAAFAVGWTPCVSAALGAILALAATHASSALVLLMAYSLGIGIPFLLVGFFTAEAESLIARAGKWLLFVQYAFGILLVALGVLIFVGELSRIANLEFVTSFLLSLNLATAVGGGIQSFNLLNLAVAFLAGLGSFLSPCILPLVPGFLAYLSSTALGKQTQL